jgi:Na+/H+ antiporter NhaD/arsenite permease-like protein
LVWGAPFAGLLASIALAPVLAPQAWHRHYPKVAIFWSAAFVGPALLADGPAETAAAIAATLVGEYLPFLILMGALFVVAGGIRVTGTPQGTPAVNTVLLAIGTVLASLIGTTGAALLVVRPLVRANRHRRHKTHVFVFFIFLVANVGGALSPLGDPPLLLGFLHGVPFLWPTRHLLLPTAIVAGGLLAVFHAIDRYLDEGGVAALEPQLERLGLQGGVNLVLLALIVAIVPLQALWRSEAGIAEIIGNVLIVWLAGLSLLMTRPSIRFANEFAWAPMIEVAWLFGAIFVTLMPLSAMIAQGLDGPAAPVFALIFSGGAPKDGLFFWLSGLLSAFLDSAPAYLVFFGFGGGSASHLVDAAPRTLLAISAGTVYFGALTYVGNAPNFMVRSIVESYGVRMPSFAAYILWAVACLLPWLLVIDALFFR